MGFFRKLFGKNTSSQLSQDKLVEILAKRIDELPDIAQVKIVNKNQIHWQSTDGISGEIFMNNLWAQYLQNPNHLEGLLEAHLAGIQSVSVTRDINDSGTHQNYFPLVKSRDWLETSKQQLIEAGVREQKISDEFVIQDINDELILTYVEDTAEQLLFLSASDAQKVGGVEALRQIAFENFTTQKLPLVDLKGAQGRYVLRLDQFFDATLILFLNHFLPEMQLDGLPLIAIPARDELLICGNNSDEDIWTLLEMVDSIYSSSGYVISNKLFRRHENGDLETVRFQRYEKDDGSRLLNEIQTD